MNPKLFEKVITNRLDAASKEFLSVNWSDKFVYAYWLSQTYYFVRHSTRLLALAAGVAKLEEQAEHERFISHISEELNHDLLAKNDLLKLGFSLSDFQESSLTTSFYQEQFEILNKIGIRPFMGWIIFLEGLATTVGPKFAETLKSHHNEIPMSFLKLHVEEDEGHLGSAFSITEHFSAEDLENVISNFDFSMVTYLNIIKEFPSINIAA